MQFRTLGRFACFAFVLVVAVSAAGVASGQPGQVLLISPGFSASFQAGSTIAVTGRVIDFNGTPIGGAQLTVRLLDSRRATIPGVEGTVVSTPGDGSFIVPLALPVTLPSGTYIISADALDASIQDREITIGIRERFIAPTTGTAIGISAVTLSAIGVVLVSLRRLGRRGK